MARATAERLLACRLARPEKESAACTSTRLFTRSRCLAWLSFFAERAGPAALLFPVHHQHFLDFFLTCEASLTQHKGRLEQNYLSWFTSQVRKSGRKV